MRLFASVHRWSVTFHHVMQIRTVDVVNSVNPIIRRGIIFVVLQAWFDSAADFGLKVMSFFALHVDNAMLQG